MSGRVSGPTSSLGRAALALRGLHVLIAAGEIASLIYLWTCALAGRRGRALNVVLVVLATEGAGLVVGRGDCPLGLLQQCLGDPVPLFEFSARGQPSVRFRRWLVSHAWAWSGSSCGGHDRDVCIDRKHVPASLAYLAARVIASSGPHLAAGPCPRSLRLQPTADELPAQDLLSDDHLGCPVPVRHTSVDHCSHRLSP